jgi:hypothetical protein
LGEWNELSLPNQGLLDVPAVLLALQSLPLYQDQEFEPGHETSFSKDELPQNGGHTERLGL